MNKFKLLAALALLFCANFALAEKIAVFNFEQAVFSTAHAQKVIQELQNNSDYAQWAAQEESIISELQTLNKQKEKEGPTWSAEQVGEYRKKVNLLQQDLQFNRNKLQNAQEELRRRILTEMQQQVETVLNQIIEAEGYEIVLNSQTVIFRTPKADITPKVVQALDKLK